MTDNDVTDPYRTRTDMSAQNLRIIDKLATAFDQAWKKGEQPQIEKYLGESPAALRAELFQSLTGAQVRMKKGGLAGVDRGELIVLMRPRELKLISR